jgi:hypothetical protein
MTRKDYEAIAAAFGGMLDETAAEHGDRVAFTVAVALMNRMLPVLEGDNPRFDYDRFADAMEAAKRKSEAQRNGTWGK